MTSPFLSIIIPTKDNSSELSDTLRSLVQVCDYDIEVIIIDGGDESVTRTVISQNSARYIGKLLYFTDKGKGVFPAQNQGIRQSKGEWVMVLNSGDILNTGACELLTKDYLSVYSAYDIIVFSQTAYSVNMKEEYSFTPTKSSIWPHQSILVRRSVYEQYGAYRDDYSYCAEQFYFAVIRKKVPYILIDKYLTVYKLGGLSSRMGLKHSREIYEVKRALGDGVAVSYFRAYITPYVRIFAERTLGSGFVNRMKKIIFRYYYSAN